MLKSRSKISQIASLFALLIALISTGAVVAHQCHSEAAPVISQTHHIHYSEQRAVQGPGNSLLGEVCVGVVFLALLLGGRYLFKTRILKSLPIFPSEVIKFRYSRKPPDLIYALTLPQLGVSRI
jgi:hypothetical protein